MLFKDAYYLYDYLQKDKEFFQKNKIVIQVILIFRKKSIK